MPKRALPRTHTHASPGILHRALMAAMSADSTASFRYKGQAGRRLFASVPQVSQFRAGWALLADRCYRLPQSGTRSGHLAQTGRILADQNPSSSSQFDNVRHCPRWLETPVLDVLRLDIAGVVNAVIKSLTGRSDYLEEIPPGIGEEGHAQAHRRNVVRLADDLHATALQLLDGGVDVVDADA